LSQWILKKPKVTTFMGGVGTDNFSEVLEKSAVTEGVSVHYQKLPEHSTGTCAVLVTGKQRSLCAYLGAANHFKKDHLEKPENLKLMQKAKFYYISVKVTGLEN
jgi:adenosine kinase